MLFLIARMKLTVLIQILYSMPHHIEWKWMLSPISLAFNLTQKYTAYSTNDYSEQFVIDNIVSKVLYKSAIISNKICSMKRDRKNCNGREETMNAKCVLRNWNSKPISLGYYSDRMLYDVVSWYPTHTRIPKMYIFAFVWRTRSNFDHKWWEHARTRFGTKKEFMVD